MKPKRKRKISGLTVAAALLAVILVVLIVILVVLEVGNRDDQQGKVDHTENTENTGAMDTPRPWDQPGAKQPEDYTWEEFLALSGELQIAFQKTFSGDAFETWMNRVMSEETEEAEQYPWEQTGAKKPEDYSWEEFLALPANQQIAFQNAFGSTAKFEAWMERVNPSETEEGTQPEETTETQEYPWEQPGAKKPEDYTWEEFLALPGDQQIAFQGAFVSNAKFEAWMERVNPQETESETQPEETTEPPEYPWERPGAKKPEDYTWEEFLALPGDQQIAFQSAFKSEAAFEAWMERVQPGEPQETEGTAQYPWEQPGAKKPEDYTWEEFLALSGEAQMAFQNAFGSSEAFEAWMNQVMPEEP